MRTLANNTCFAATLVTLLSWLMTGSGFVQTACALPEESSLEPRELTFDPIRDGQAISDTASNAGAQSNADLNEISTWASQPFGIADSWRWSLRAGTAADFDGNNTFLGGAGVTYFMADFISVDIELSGLYVHQDGPNATGISLSLLLTWHFWRNDANTFSVYADAGAGLLYVSDDVPEDGTEFNFNPQVGLGVSFDVWDGNRMFVGSRWYHVSNARVFDSNPGRDNLLFYAGVSFPF